MTGQAWSSSSFRLMSSDFQGFGGKSVVHRKSISSKLKTLKEYLIEKLPKEFDDFRSSLYVSRFRERGSARLRSVMWLGMADSTEYPQPREALAFQFGIDKSCTGSGIWIGPGYPRRETRIDMAQRISENREHFRRMLRKLGSDYYVEYYSERMEDAVQPSKITHGQIDQIIDSLPNANSYFWVYRKWSKRQSQELGTRIGRKIISDWQRLLPLYGFLAREPFRRGMPERSRGQSLIEAMEGEQYLSEARFRARNRALVEQKKADSDYRCEVCEMSFEDVYGEIGNGYIVAHHIKPIGKGRRSTTLQDIALVCPNCHAMLHRKDLVNPINILELQGMIRR